MSMYIYIYSDQNKTKYKVSLGEEYLSFEEFRNVCLLIESSELSKSVRWVRSSYIYNNKYLKYIFSWKMK